MCASEGKQPKTQCTIIMAVKYILKPKISFGVERSKTSVLRTVPGKGLLEYEFEYFAVPEQKKGSQKKINYTIQSIEPFVYDWTYLSGKDA